MNRPHRGWYFLALALALLPAGLRVLTTHRQQSLPVDEDMARAGLVLFTHEWKPNDPLAAGGDGLGPVFNASSCVACHNQGGVGGAGDLTHNVTTFTVQASHAGGQGRSGVVHAFAVDPKLGESLTQVNASLPTISRPTLNQLVSFRNSSGHCLTFPRGVHISQRNTPALFGLKLIDEIPDRVLIAQERSERLKLGMAAADREDMPVGRALRLADGRVGRFGWKAQMASLSDFVQAACANELGLGNPGAAQPAPLGAPGYQPPGPDLTLEQCDQLTAFVASLPRPNQRLPEESGLYDEAVAGKRIFSSVGCAECHVQKLGSADDIYSDLLLHRMGETLVGGGSYGEPPLPRPEFKASEGPLADEWRTPPLWGVADSAPYLHDGRAPTLEEAINLHGGQGAPSAQRFANLSAAEKLQLVAFLKTLRAP